LWKVCRLFKYSLCPYIQSNFKWPSHFFLFGCALGLL
jgi:hypothetical protein